MKLTDFLSDVGRPIAYYPSLRKITGSTTATILLCQFIYWRGKESDPNGWLYKTSDDIEEETGLSYNEQKTARANLVSAELIEEHYARLDHQMKFRVNLDMINLLWGTEQIVIPESGNPSFGKAIIHDSLNESEITAENTTENASLHTDEDQGEYNTELFRGDYRDYPQSVQEIARVLRDTWKFSLPEKPQKKSKGQYGFYIQAMEAIKQSCAEFGADVLVKVHADWKAGFKNGLAPYTVAQPTSLVNMCAAKARELRDATPTVSSMFETLS